MNDFDAQLERRRTWVNRFYAFLFICIFAAIVGSVAMFFIKLFHLG